MHDHGMKTDPTKEEHVLGECLLQLGIDHGVPAELDHHHGASKLLQPRQRLNQNLGLLVGK